MIVNHRFSRSGDTRLDGGCRIRTCDESQVSHTKFNHVLARNVARKNVVDANEVKIAAEREGDKIAVKKDNGDAGSSQFFCRSLTDFVFVGGKFKRCEEHTAYIAADEILTNILGIVNGQVRGWFAVRPQEAVVFGSRQTCKFLANKIQDFGYFERRQKHP